MAYNGIAWPGVKLAVNAIRASRGREARKLKLASESPGLFKRPTDVKRRTSAAIAQYDAALAILRDAERAMTAPAKPRRRRSAERSTEPDSAQ